MDVLNLPVGAATNETTSCQLSCMRPWWPNQDIWVLNLFHFRARRILFPISVGVPIIRYWCFTSDLLTWKSFKALFNQTSCVCVFLVGLCPRWAKAVLVCWFILKVNHICRIKYSLLTWAWYSSPASCGFTPMKVGQLEGGVPGVEHAEGVYGNICLSVHHQKQHRIMVYSRHVKLLSPCLTMFMLTRRRDRFKGKRSI